MLAQGYPAYTTSCAWLGYSDDTLKQVGILTWLCKQAEWGETNLFFLLCSHHCSQYLASDTRPVWFSFSRQPVFRFFVDTTWVSCYFTQL